ncbi:MAG: TIGR01212 family radical SAM protein [Thermodesulfobacteria bacterium]|nr:TIGR01212 family radical SAM protein [Thermodesulfobacteriota bacterium]
MSVNRLSMRKLLSQKRYHALSDFLRARFGERVQKVTIDAGFTCPNRDGTRGRGGCIYCNAYGSGTGAAREGLSIREQMLAGMERLARRYKARKFIAYFQAFSNTYAPPEVLRARYDEALVDDRVVGLAVGTRPDCVDEEVCALLASYRERGLMVWLEMGLQSAHNETLARINRGHTFEDFRRALELAKKHDLLVCTHVIFGLPGEGPQEMLATIERISDLPLDGIKFHELYVVRGTRMEELYRRGEYKPLLQTEYVDLVCESLAMLPWRVVVQRLTGDPRPEELVAPEWARDKRTTLKMIEETLLSRDLWQGKYRGEPDPLLRGLPGP